MNVLPPLIKRIHKLLIVGFLIFSNVSILAEAGDLFPKEGKLFFGGGLRIIEFDLSNLSRRVFFKFSGQSFIYKIAKYDENNFFVSGSMKEMGLFNIKDKTFKPLRKGHNPVLMKKQGKVLFFNAPSYEVGSGLYIGDIDKLDSAIRILDNTGSLYNNIIPVSDYEVVFIKKDAHARNNPVWMYNLNTNKFKKLPIENCTFPKLWRSKTKQLLCFDRKLEKHFFIGLDGKNRQTFEWKKSAKNWVTVGTYLPEYDAMIVTLTGSRWWGLAEGRDFWIYNFATGKAKQLGVGDGFVNQGVLYYPVSSASTD